MGNREIGIEHQNGDNRKEALRVIAILKERQKKMKRQVVETIVDGKKTIIEKFTVKKKKI